MSLPTQPGMCPVAHGSPTRAGDRRVPLFTPEFAADPHSVYRDMRRHRGPYVPIELAPGVPATLVIGYRAALTILHDEARFPADPSEWARRCPPDSPLLEMLGPRDNALRKAGREHLRYRAPLSCLETVDRLRLEGVVDRHAERLINARCGSGAMDLRHDYALPLTFSVLSELMGFPADVAATAYRGMAAILEGTEDAAQGGQDFVAAIGEVVAAKRRSPGTDLTSQMIVHPERLGDLEVIQSAALLFAAGTEPTTNLVLNTVWLSLIDERFAGGVISGTLQTADAVDEVLFTDPPLANFCVTYPRRRLWIEADDYWLPAHEPVVISLTACNNDPAIARAGMDRTGNRSHLSWGAGPHACPAKQVALTIALRMLDLLFDALPEMRLAIPSHELLWRPGPFHRAPMMLPVEFAPTAPMALAAPPLSVPTRPHL
ncbi:cytochrome P450 [Nocardia sp. GP40]|uniref:cytochrome P450 n=1 Tax=Nocardia sp. GP40 TaxID=3156268 RepID=UPI003D1BCFFC